MALFGALIAGSSLAGCTYVATTTDMCAYTQGDGRDGRDANIHNVYLPGQQAQKSNTENVYYFACNARNIRLMDGSTDVRADGKPVGPVVAYTKDSIQVVVSNWMGWTLNQDANVLKTAFFPLCNKYNCATDKADVRNANFATDGWSKGFLGENATPAYEKAVRDTIAQYSYADAMKPDVQNTKLNADIAAAFMQNMRATTGSTKDLMCSSGDTSGWSDPSKPGTGNFNCGPVRITIDKIVPQDESLLRLQQEQAKAEMAKTINAKQLEAAQAKYGADAGKILGQIDIATQACAAAKTGCVVSVGGGDVAVSTASTPK